MGKNQTVNPIPTIIRKQEQSSGEVSKPVNNQYNSKPPEARVPYPSVPANL